MRTREAMAWLVELAKLRNHPGLTANPPEMLLIIGLAWDNEIRLEDLVRHCEPEAIIAAKQCGLIIWSVGTNLWHLQPSSQAYRMYHREPL